jgi:hypothetical protein
MAGSRLGFRTASGTILLFFADLDDRSADHGGEKASTVMRRRRSRAAVREAASSTRENTSADYHVEYAPAALAA